MAVSILFSGAKPAFSDNPHFCPQLLCPQLFCPQLLCPQLLCPQLLCPQLLCPHDGEEDHQPPPELIPPGDPRIDPRIDPPRRPPGDPQGPLKDLPRDPPRGQFSKKACKTNGKTTFLIPEASQRLYPVFKKP